MKFKKRQRKNPQDLNSAGKYYAIPVNTGKISLDDMASRIARSSSLTRGDVLNVLTNLIDEIPDYLKDGKSVQLGELGTLRMSFSSEGTEKPEILNADKIRNIKVVFIPGMKLKHELRNTTFTELK